MHCGNPFAPIQIIAGDTRENAVFSIAGYLMNAGHFRKNTVSTGDLNRPRSPEVRKPLACFLILFARRKKNVKTSPLQGTPRFSKPRISPPQPQLRTATIKTFLRKFRGFANLEAAHTDNKLAQTKLNPFAALGGCFCRFAAFSAALGAVFPPCGGPLLPPQQFPAASRLYPAAKPPNNC